MTAKIVNLSSLDDEDDEYLAFIEDLKDNNKNAIFIVEKEDGEVFVGCNYENVKDLVFAIHKIMKLANAIVDNAVNEGV